MLQLDDEASVRRAAFNHFTHGGLNCAESVLKAVLTHNGKSCPPGLLATASAFGAGIGGGGCVCGALAGGVIAMGALFGKDGKALANALHEDFRQENGATCCRILSRDLIIGSPERLAACAQRTAAAAGFAAAIVRREYGERHKRRELIAAIIAAEWKMFEAIRCPEGKNPCAGDPDAFRHARESQFLTWNTEMLSSWLADLDSAEKAGRNPLEEKYARMMEITHPREFSAIAPALPEISSEKNAYVTAISRVHRDWVKLFEEDYPHVAAYCRPGMPDASRGITSSDTYLSGELKTYSLNTLKLYNNYIAECQAAARNIAIENFSHMARRYGFASLEEAEHVLASKNAHPQR